MITIGIIDKIDIQIIFFDFDFFFFHIQEVKPYLTFDNKYKLFAKHPKKQIPIKI